MEADDKSNVASNSAAEIEKTNNISLIKENYCVVSSAPKPHVDSSNVMHVQDAPKVGGYSNSQGVEDYNQLLNQYYEVEEQRQKILQQLHQWGNWNNHFSMEGSSHVQWGTSSNCQECQVPTSQASHPTIVCSCCPYISQCLVTPCSLPACSMGEACVGKTCIDATAAMASEKRLAVEDADIVKAAMGAAEKAISSMRMKTSGIPNQNEGTSFFQARDLYENLIYIEFVSITLSNGVLIKSQASRWKLLLGLFSFLKFNSWIG